MTEIEYTFKDGTTHIIPETNQGNFERIFSDKILSSRIAGQQAVVRVHKAPASQEPQKKEIVSFPIEEPKAPVTIPAAHQNTIAPPAQDEVIEFNEN